MIDEPTRYKAVVLYKMTGNLSCVAQQLGLDYSTVLRWRKEDWWKEAEETVRLQQRAGLKTSLQKIVDKALVEVEDRLVNGDWFYDQKKGELIRRPLGAHITNQILKDSFDRRFFIEKLEDNVKNQETSEKIQERLLRLAEDFENFARMKTIEGEKTDAVHDKRETGLQEGTSPVRTQTSGTDQEEGSEPRSPSPHGEEGIGTQG